MDFQIQLLEVSKASVSHVGGSNSLWHHPVLMQAIAEMHGLTAYQLRVYKGEELVALMPIYERRKLGMRAIVAPVVSYYQGISFCFETGASNPRKLLDSSYITNAIADYMQANFRKVSFKLYPENNDVRSFSWKNFKVKPFYTFYHVLSEELPTLSDEKKKARKAEALGCTLASDYQPEAFIELQKALDIDKNHSLGVSYPKLKSCFDTLYTAGLLQQVNVIQDSQIISADIVLSDGGETAYTIFLATSPEAKRIGAATFHSLGLSQVLHPECKVLDFCGANIPEVARFKAALGLTLKVFFHIST